MKQSIAERAKKRKPKDPAVAACWPIVVQGLGSARPADATLLRMVACMRRGEDFQMEEFGLTFEKGELLVSFLDQEARCPAEALAAELEALARP